MQRLAAAALLCLTLPVGASAEEQQYVPYTVDTGSHTCTSQGQEVKIPKDFTTTPDRYFVRDSVKFTEVSKFGHGYCTITNVREEKIEVTLASGKKVQISVPVAYSVLADADCTSNPGNLGSRIGTECSLSAKTERND